MPKGYEFFDHTADIGARIYGATLPELFSNAAQAMYEVIGKLEKTGVRSQESEDGSLPAAGGAEGGRQEAKGERQRTIGLEAESLEDLLHDWLTELLYDFSTRQVLYDRLDITEVTPQRIVATVTGGVVDFARSELREEIKGVTYHQLRVEQTADGRWQATVIFDV